MLATCCIFALACFHEIIYNFLITLGARDALKAVRAEFTFEGRKHHELLQYSRRALVSLSDTHVLSVVKRCDSLITITRAAKRPAKVVLRQRLLTADSDIKTLMNLVT
jgi:hypothetical protein